MRMRMRIARIPGAVLIGVAVGVAPGREVLDLARAEGRRLLQP